MLNRLKHLSRLNKQFIMYGVDSIILIIILLASFSVRLGYWYYPDNSLFLVVFCSPLIAIPIFIRFGLYRTVIRYFEFKALWRIVQAVSLYALVWGVVGFMSATDGIPRSVILINWVQTIVAIVGVRIFARSLMVKTNKNIKSGEFKKALVYGAGDAGVQLVNALEHSSEYIPVGFIDDSNELQNHKINGLEIYSIIEINYLINKFQIDEILIAMPSVSKNKRRNIIQKLEKYPVLVKVLPSMSELAEGKVRVDDLKEVSIKDLLGREAVEPNRDLLGQNITKKVVLVTGAGGSIGSELCRQIILLKPSVLVLYENNELALYNIENELEKTNAYSLDIFPILENLKPDFICTRWIDVNRAYYPGRGSDSLQEISLLNIRSKSDHSPGCVYRTSLIESAEPIILQRLAKECMATFFYPQVILLYVAKLNNAKLYNSPVLMGGYKEEGPLESNLTDLKGNHYTSLGTIFMQYLGFQEFYKEMIIKFDHSKHIKELQLTLESHELSLYGLIDDAISIQSKISAHHFRIGSSRNLLNPFRLFSFFIIFLYQKIKTKFYAK